MKKLTEKDIKRIARTAAESYFDKRDFHSSIMRNIKAAIETGIKEAIAEQNEVPPVKGL